MPVPTGGRNCRRLAAETRGDRTPSMVSCPLLTPQTFLLALTHRRCAAKRGLQGLGSVRRADFETLLCPEFPLRKVPRITVRGHPVQSVRLALRTAPLPSRMCPWSTRRPCGPLAFRRATEGSRVSRRVWGSQEGEREPYGALSPFCPLPGTRHPRPPKAANDHALRGRKVASTGCAAVSAEDLPSAEIKEFSLSLSSLL